MFAYCGNNPISRADFGGHAFVQIDYNYSDSADLLFPTLGGGGGGCVYAGAAARAGANVAQKVKEEIYNTNVTSVKTKLDENGVAFYKGTLVVAVDIMGTSALSLGVILMGSGNLERADFADTLNHEYGHYVHMKQIGVPAYTATTAVPSLAGACLSYFVPFIDENYMSQPWERIANQLGGVNDTYLPGADTAGALYYIYTQVISAVIP